MFLKVRGEGVGAGSHLSGDLVSNLRKFHLFAWIVLLYNVGVVAWGAYVRATFSGDGCGDHWPDCGGQVIPTNATLTRIIEFSHRASSGVALILVVALALFAITKLPKFHQARKAAIGALFFTVTEALLGAGLVLFKLVAHNDSVYRAVAMCSHLTNTFILLACLTMAALLSVPDVTIRRREQGAAPYLLGLGAFLLLALGMSGALSALGHMLKPTDNVLATAMAPGAHYLNRLQPLHPLISVSVFLYLLLMSGMLIHLRPSPHVKAAAQWTMLIYTLQLSLGLVNIAIQAPVWMQLVHLMAADAVWIAFVSLATAAMRSDVPVREMEHPNLALIDEYKPVGKALVKDYIALTKPRVISLLLFTTLAALFTAAGTRHEWPSLLLVLGVTLGGYMSAGAANTINMVIDRDIDGTMKRTSKRPTVTEHISSRSALLFALGLAVLSFGLLCATANLLAALLSLAGLVYYVIVYTMLLKRRTWHNIVIGGAAGAFPPLVGWSAVTGDLSPLALYLFAIIFMWTPVHFWALALLIKDDYAEAGVPMLPVVHGERVTTIQIGLYAILTTIVSVMPLFQRSAGWLYMTTVIALNVILLARCLTLYRSVNRPNAVSLYKFSMLYLAILFLMVAVDRAVLS
ncbi:MAG: protoheme IX farnesyltransferase [Armatimonadetes bacterium]|nr:protoheme IX farnesyltransferase [Armatimonadota bacterium]